MQGAATQAMPGASSRSGNTAGTRPSPPRPFGCGPQAHRLCARSLHTAAGMLVARASPAGLGASSKV